MKILFIGNISSGKSRTCEVILDQFPFFELVSIDSIRKEYGDGTEEKENQCQEILLNSIKKPQAQIIEISGIGYLGKRTVQSLNTNNPLLILYPRCKRLEINRRNAVRKWDTPFPYNPGNISAAVSYTHKELSSELLAQILGRLPEATMYSFANDTEHCFKKAVQDILYIIQRCVNEL